MRKPPENMVIDLRDLERFFSFSIAVNGRGLVTYASIVFQRKFKKTIGRKISQILEICEFEKELDIPVIESICGQRLSFVLKGSNSRIIGDWVRSGSSFILLAVPELRGTEDLQNFALSDFPIGDLQVDLISLKDEATASMKEASLAAKTLKEKNKELEKSKKYLDDQRRAVLNIMQDIEESRQHYIKINAELQKEIEDRKQAEDALRESEQRYRSLVENISIGVVMINHDLEILTANEKILNWFPKLDLTSKSKCYISLHDPPLEKPCEECAVIQTLRDGKVHESVQEIKIGDEQRSFKKVASPITDDQGNIIAAIEMLEDITSRVQNEIAKARLTTAVEQTAEAVVITDIEGNIQYVNPAFSRMTGYSQEETIGQNPRILKSGKHNHEFYKELWNTIVGGDIWSGRIVNRKKDGNFYHEEMTISPVRDTEGKIVNFVALKRDITEQITLETQLRQAQKLESIGQLAAGVAHEINTPTQYVGDNIHFLQESFGELSAILEKYGHLHETAKQGKVDSELLREVERAVERADVEYLKEEIPKAIEQSLDGVGRVSEIVRAMKEFSHPGQEEKVATDINKAIVSTVTVATNEWKYVAEMELYLDETLPLVPCLPGEFNQVILNLTLNATHAIADVVGDGSAGKGKIKISTRAYENWVEIRVSDTGTGIPEEIRERIFDPFFTTKGVGRGTGQGLAIAHSVVVDKHGGTITFETEKGKGTIFIIRLPLISEGGESEIEFEETDLVR